MSFGRGSFFIVISTNLHCALEHNHVVHLLPFVPVPSSDHSRITERQVCLFNLVISKEIFPIISQKFSEETSFIYHLADVANGHTRQHKLTSRLSVY